MNFLEISFVIFMAVFIYCAMTGKDPYDTTEVDDGPGN